MNLPDWIEVNDLTTSCALFGGTLVGRVALNWAIQSTRKAKALARESSSKRQDRALIRKKFSEKHIPKDIDTIIIGSGMGGLSCAAILSRLGRKVLVLEQHEDVAGGGTHQFDLNGYRFDSGLHYTVPWSVPIFQLTCLKSEDEVTPFDLMGDKNDVVDKIYLRPTDSINDNNIKPFNMKHKEKHLEQLYKDFPNEHKAINEFIKISDDAMLFVKYFIASRLLPQWLQNLYWKYIVPKNLISIASKTAKEILPTLTNNKHLISLLSSMWIDTGARPDIASFMLTSAVFRGVSMEGGCYPREGSEAMAIELAKVITNNGGTILIRAPVKEILIENNHTTGVIVQLTNNKEQIFIPSKRVVSSVGYINTYKYLISNNIIKKYNIPKELKVSQSAGFVMINIGINASPTDLDIDNTNTWHIPVDSNYDCFPSLEEYFHSPLNTKGGYKGIPAFITFPGIKDKEWSKSHPNKTSCQMLMMAEYSWFDQQKNNNTTGNTTTTSNSSVPVRTQAYLDLKENWKNAGLEIFYMYYPKARGKVELADVSTPQTIEHWLNAEKGGAVGIDVTPERFTDPTILQQLDIATPIPNLYMTGQDTVLCGVTICQLAGVITAFRMEGFCAAVNIISQSVFKDLRNAWLS